MGVFTPGNHNKTMPANLTFSKKNQGLKFYAYKKKFYKHKKNPVTIKWKKHNDRFGKT
jgi:hypothetical protein